MWLNLAAAQSSIDAAVLRDAWRFEMTPSQIEKAQALAAGWKPKSGQ